jgi:predicted GTPase
MRRIKVIIMGAAGRDFHNFNMYFRNNPLYQVVAFTAAQIPNIEGRVYPAQLAGKDLYPDGIPIFGEEELPTLIKKHQVDQVVFSYSDISHEAVMHKATNITAIGPDFRLMGTQNTLLITEKPVVSVCAVRTGAGKSPTTRRICEILRNHGMRTVVVRHPMPYGDLTKQVAQKFATIDDLSKHQCTIEEREEYEHHLKNGVVVYAGIDYEQVLRKAEQEADIIVWDGGNNDFPFYRSSSIHLHIVVVDPHRPGHELTYYPGETNLHLADVIVINKQDTADIDSIEQVRANVKALNPEATIIDAALPIRVRGEEDKRLINNAKVLVVEDGPTVTHGEMRYGAGLLAAKRYFAREIVEPRKYAVGSIVDTFEKYPHLEKVLPAMGYSKEQIEELESTINRVECDLVISGTPVDLRKILNITKPIVHVEYDLLELSKPDLEAVLYQKIIAKLKTKTPTHIHHP